MPLQTVYLKTFLFNNLCLGFRDSSGLREVGVYMGAHRIIRMEEGATDLQGSVSEIEGTF